MTYLNSTFRLFLHRTFLIALAGFVLMTWPPFASITFSAQESKVKQEKTGLTATAFTYQGQLKDANGPVNGSFDFQFVLYPAQTGGESLRTSEIQDVTITNGMFNLTLDFGLVATASEESWLEIGVRTSGSPEEYTVLFPRQKLTPTPYAIFAQREEWSLIGVPVGFPNHTDQEALLVEKETNQKPGQEAEEPPQTDTPAQAGGWTDDGAVVRLTDTTDRVGIGTTTPNHRLSIIGGPAWTSNGWTGSIEMGNASAIGWQANAAGQRVGIGHTGGGFFIFRTTSNPGTSTTPALYDFAINDVGNVGIGVTQPTSKLEIAAQDGLKITGYQPFLTLRDSNAGNARGVIQSVNGGMNLFTESYLSSANPFAYISLNNSGNVGIGSATPASKLDIVAQDALGLIGYQPFLTFKDSNAGYVRSRIQGVNGEMVLETESYISGANPTAFIALRNSGNVGIGTANPQARLDVAGMTRTGVLQITGGADLSEQFEVSATTDINNDASSEQILPGMVVSIDPDNPGKLVVSNQAYDHRVAGIISGAGGVKPGMLMSQAGSVADGEHPVALTGRVYCLVDASYSAIEPGDLLTTSATPGHAMKVRNHALAHGSIIGKAMTSLKDGRGFVLVLVTLQ